VKLPGVSQQEELIPAAFAAVAARPALHAQVAPELARQQALIAAHAPGFVGRRATVAALDALIAEERRGIVALEGVAGAGVTALLCKLAVERRGVAWLRGDDDRAGAAALCAQLIALHGLAPPLVAPLAARDARELETLLARAAATRAAADPLLLLVDGWQRIPGSAYPALFPRRLPAGVLLLCGVAAGAAPPLPPEARLRLPTSGPDLYREMAEALRQAGCAPHTAARLIAHSGGSFLYLELGQALFERGLLDLERLPQGLDALLAAWWRATKPRPHAPDLAALLAASRSPLPLGLLAWLLDAPAAQLAPLLAEWAPLLRGDAGEGFALAHAAIRAALHKQLGRRVARAHTLLLDGALRQAGPRLKPAEAIHPALARQLPASLPFSPERRAQVAPLLVGREWVAARERIASLDHAARDAASALRAAALEGDLPLLARATITLGTVGAVARTLPPDAVAEALEEALGRAGNNAERGAALKAIQALVEQLTEGRARARVLRRIGEVCFAHGMRGAAMRLLSQALDMEDQVAPRSWQDERDQALAALARAALGIGDSTGALEISARIRNAERRGQSETELVRWLLAQANLPRAEKTAEGISDEGMRDWALAEVAVEYARGGDSAAATTLLARNTTATAVSWAQTELACDLALGDFAAALELATAFEQPAQRDRAHARIAAVLAAAGRPQEALATLARIAAPVARVEALIELASSSAPALADKLATALNASVNEIVSLDDATRPPLLAGIAAALAACRRPQAVGRTLALLAEGDERDRARGKVVVALARIGQAEAADAMVRTIGDDDERDWARGELARYHASAHARAEAYRQAEAIGDRPQRDALLAELAIAQARAGEPAKALAWCDAIEDATGRARTLIAIAVAFGAAGDAPTARATLERLADPDLLSRGRAALAAALAPFDQEGARVLAHSAARPADQTRALVELARAATDRGQAVALLGEALLIAGQLGRADSLRALEQAAPTLATLGGFAPLEAAALALDDVDDWWRR
jgi:hypothetical protein